MNGEEYSSNAPRPMTVSEIQETTAEYAEAAKRARRAGFDGVEIHGKSCQDFPRSLLKIY